jgi:Tfp pilus assembly major pilin PilA
MLTLFLIKNTSKNRKSKQLQAFTLFEVLLCVGIMAILVAILLPITQTLLFQDEQGSMVNLAAKTLRATQQFALNGDGDNSWGVKFQNGSITEFKGSSYALRDTTADAVITVTSRISFSGTTEIVFSNLRGTPAAAATVNVVENNVSKAITVSALGMISY